MAVKTYGRIIDKMVVRNPTGLKIALGENPITTYGQKQQAPVTRMGTMGLIRSLFMKAQDYQQQKEQGNLKNRDAGMEAALLALKGVVPVRAHAHRADDMVSAIRLADEFGLRLIIEHGTEGYLIKDYLKEKNVAVAVGPMLTPRIKMELNKRSYRTAMELIEAGIATALITDHPYNSIEHLRLAAVLTCREGLEETLAVQAITQTPARILDAGDRIGSLEAGKDADLVVMDGPPMDIRSKVEMVFIQGSRAFQRKEPEA